MCARWPPVSTVTGLERSTAVLQYCVSDVLWYTVLCDSTAVSQRWKPSQRLHSFQEWIPHIWSSLVGWLPWLPATGFHSLIHFLSPRSSAPLWFVFFFFHLLLLTFLHVFVLFSSSMELFLFCFLLRAAPYIRAAPTMPCSFNEIQTFTLYSRSGSKENNCWL